MLESRTCGIVLGVAVLGVALRFVSLGSDAQAQRKDSGTYDLVISGGRVMDPESGLDSVRNVGISDGKIRAISSEPLRGQQTVEAKGLVVAPGFIDLHEHGQEPRNYQFQAHDGVTTSLELEAGTNDVAKWYARREAKALINFGVSIGHIPVRAQVVGHGQGELTSAVTRSPEVEAALHREASPEELSQMKA